MTVEIPPMGSRGAEMPKFPRPFMHAMRSLMLWTARFDQNRLVILTTTGAKTGQPHSVTLGRFPDGEDAFLVVASNAGSARHPAWFLNLMKNPDRVWAQIGKRKFKVRPQLLAGAERDAAMQRVVAASPGYAAYEQKTDRVIPVIRLTPDEGERS